MKYDFEKLMKENMNIQESPSKELNERILNYDREERTMNNKKRKFMQQLPKIAAAALAVVLLSGGIAYASSGLWNRFVAKDFGVEDDHEAMKDMNDKGFAQQPQAKGMKSGQLSVTDKDITVTVQQTLADEHSAYVCFEVKYGEQYQAVQKGKSEESDYGVAMPKVDFQADTGMRFNYSGSIAKIVDDHTVLYDYFLTTTNMDDTFEDCVLTMALSSFVMNEEDAKTTVLAKDGNWNLSWDLSVGTEKQVYHLNKTLTLGENHVIVKDLEISPLSCNLTLESPDEVCLDEIHAVVEDMGEENTESLLDENGDIRVIRYLHELPLEKYLNKITKELPEGQKLMSFDTMAIRMDGKDFDGMGGISYVDMNVMYTQFDKILNPEEIKGIRVGGKYIDLTALSYETVK